MITAEDFGLSYLGVYGSRLSQDIYCIARFDATHVTGDRSFGNSNVVRELTEKKNV